MRRLTLVLLLAALVAPTGAQAAFPGQNGKVAFSSNRDGDFEIYAMNADGTDVRKLTDNSVSDTQPAWSPDGTRIAFASARDPSAPDCDGFFVPCNTEIYFMNADGSQQSRLTSTLYLEDTPAWTADGSSISFHRVSECGSFGCNDEIVTLRIDGTGAGFSPRGCAAADPAWSPDGAKLAFRQIQYDDPCNGGAGLFTIRSDGSERQRICCPDALGFSGFAPDWAPDQSAIAVSSVSSCSTGCVEQIAKVNPDGSGATPIHTNALYPAWSPDGTKIAFRNGADGDGEIYLTSPDGIGDVRLTDNTFDDTHPDWQPIPNRPPDCSGVTASPSVLRPVTGRFVPVALDGATDPDGDPISLSIDGVTQDEPVKSRGDRTSPDAVDAGDGEVRLRAERSPFGDGRVYRISFTASDGKGASCSGTATASVPRKKKKAAVDSAPPSFDSSAR